ncbi:DUF1828 domain-containing protein [Pseudomonas sp. R5(2019)]|uniref:DUF1828 domain-containing protein n=1 Tax=Pseudomonas sp. R5(2019) TaxID=2697566 RepID=UPI0014120694|nr:DUF1828 domain-containing protein [Pseudomonas sp. R5(2019)]NBA95534.1 DUF1828 domain-containing protein [Pseudomonas sp. R5(2019)]
MYIQSPISLSFDGMLIGAFLQDIGRGLVRITDNSDILFTAMTHGIAPDSRKSKKFETIAKSSGISLSENGELHTTCPDDQVGFYVARFIEAASRIGDACDDMLVVHVPKFELSIGRVLSKRFQKSLRKGFALVGASGHQLAFPFALNAGTDKQMVIQTISSGSQGKPNWGSIYGAVGKMGDLKNSGDRTKRTIILQDGDPESIHQATLALAETASIIIYSGDENALVSALRAA